MVIHEILKRQQILSHFTDPIWVQRFQLGSLNDVRILNFIERLSILRTGTRNNYHRIIAAIKDSHTFNSFEDIYRPVNICIHCLLRTYP